MLWAVYSLTYWKNLHTYWKVSLTAVRHGDEVLNFIVKLFAAAVNHNRSSFVLIDDNECHHRGTILEEFLKFEGIACNH